MFFMYDFFARQEEEPAPHVDPVKWSERLPFKKHLLIEASSYKPKSLFEVSPEKASNPNSATSFSTSPSGRWMYRERILPKGAKLTTRSGNRSGYVWFTDEVAIPMLHDRSGSGWRSTPWMSYTPMEVFTLRSGIRRARGHTVIAGLGMGYQLERVCAKKNVKKVTLVEIDDELVDWILPRLDLSGKDVDVVVGDAEKVVPELDYNVALIDIYPCYGKNGAKIQRLCTGRPGELWVWGSAWV